MAVGLYQVVAKIPSVSNVPDDLVENVWHFVSNSAGSEAADSAIIFTRLANWYNTSFPGLSSVATHMSETLNRAANACSFLSYFTTDFDGSTPFGSPVATGSWTLNVVTPGKPLPSEVAVVNSFHGDLTDVPETAPNPSPPPLIIRPAARRRGRVYIGPLQDVASVEDATTHVVRPTTLFLNTLAEASQTMAQANDQIAWCVWSKRDAAEYPVTGGFIDNAFDTQRRRGESASGRTVWVP